MKPSKAKSKKKKNVSEDTKVFCKMNKNEEKKRSPECFF